MNGYISVELGGKVRGIKFGNRVLLDAMGKHKVGDGLVFSFALIVDLIFGGLVNNCAIKNVAVDFTEQDVYAWADDMPMEELTKVFEAFQDSYTPKEDKPIGKAVTGGKKK